ncbi:MAG TPA: transcription termination/antitermination NusG family protein [Pirellulales bacterium]|jgi:transcription antitermination factor NusG|nr:transcription termination/antitermination NusG family protein [Pirellulales bacterium]
MPILPPETDLYPADLLEESSDLPWWAVYTMARREKDLMRRLLKLEIPFYSPLVSKKGRSPSGRVRVSQVPLFAGYVFFRGDADQRREALATNCISQCLAVSDPEQLRRDLANVRRLILSQQPLTAESRLEPGARVRIKTGPLMGLEGVILKRHGQERLLVAVQFLQQGASIQIEDFVVERIDG